jgi:hypothetical protein
VTSMASTVAVYPTKERVTCSSPAQAQDIAPDDMSAPMTQQQQTFHPQQMQNLWQRSRSMRRLQQAWEQELQQQNTSTDAVSGEWPNQYPVLQQDSFTAVPCEPAPPVRF